MFRSWRCLAATPRMRRALGIEFSLEPGTLPGRQAADPPGVGDSEALYDLLRPDLHVANAAIGCSQTNRLVNAPMEDAACGYSCTEVVHE